DADMVNFVNAMNAGQVNAVLLHGVNPAYDYFDHKKFIDGLKKVKLSVSFNDRMDETTQLCGYAVPDHHWLESWGDAEPRTGHYSFIQPTIAPLFKTRAFQDSLLTWVGGSESYYDMYTNYWVGKLGSRATFDKALQDGLAEPESVTLGGASFSGNISEALNKVNTQKSEGKYEVVVYEKVSIGYGGAWSNNPWLQEMPDPITKATWDNYICMSPKTAKESFDAELTGINQVVREKRIAKVKVGNNEVALPIVVVPGMHDAVVAVATGYGRDKQVGRA